MRLQDKVAVVTGGARGIGAAICERYAAEGARVIVADLLETEAQALARSLGHGALAVPLDVTRQASIDAMVARVVQEAGRIDVLVNNAGRSAARPFDEVSDEDWQADLDLKLMAAVRTVRLVIPHMRKVGGGRIINIVNLGGKQPGARSMPTSVSRAAGMALTKALSKDLAADQITVNAVCIGTIKSAQHERTWRQAGSPGTLDQWYVERGKSIPLGRVGEAKEVGDLIAFLASERAAYLTGTAINLDGGTSAVL